MSDFVLKFNLIKRRNFFLKEIDWGDFSASVDDVALTEDTAADINNIDLEALRNEISVEGTGVYVPSDGMAKDTDALFLIEWNDTRNLLIFDLQQV